MAALAPLENLLKLKVWNALRLMRQGIYGDEMSRSQILYIVAHDDSSGRLRLQKDRVVVDWPGYSAAPERVRAEQKVKAMIESMGGVFVGNPFAMTAFGGNRIIAHPLGGCAMAETVEIGVVAPDGGCSIQQRGRRAFTMDSTCATGRWSPRRSASARS